MKASNYLSGTHRFEQVRNEKNNHFLLHFRPKYIVTTVTRFTIMGIVLFQLFKELLELAFLSTYFILYTSLTQRRKTATTERKN